MGSEPDDKTVQVSEAELKDLSSFGTEATIFFSVSASAISLAMGLWLSVDPAAAAKSATALGNRFVLYGGIPFFATFGIVCAVLGRMALVRHRDAVREIRSRTPLPKNFDPQKDGMNVDLNIAPPK